MTVSAASMTALLAARMAKKRLDRVVNTSMLANMGEDLQDCLNKMKRAHPDDATSASDADAATSADASAPSDADADADATYAADPDPTYASADTAVVVDVDAADADADPLSTVARTSSYSGAEAYPHADPATDWDAVDPATEYDADVAEAEAERTCSTVEEVDLVDLTDDAFPIPSEPLLRAKRLRVDSSDG